MKRSAMIKRLKRILEKNENSKATTAAANEILECVLEAGMEPPFSKQRDLGCECGCHGWCAKGNSWDYEHELTGEYAKDGRTSR